MEGPLLSLCFLCHLIKVENLYACFILLCLDTGTTRYYYVLFALINIRAFTKTFQSQKDENWSLPIMFNVFIDLRLFANNVSIYNVY